MNEWIMITHMLICWRSLPLRTLQAKTNQLLFLSIFFYLFIIINLWMASLFITLYDVDPFHFVMFLTSSVSFFFFFFYTFLFFSAVFLIFSYHINHGCQKEITIYVKLRGPWSLHRRKEIYPNNSTTTFFCMDSLLLSHWRSM